MLHIFNSYTHLCSSCVGSESCLGSVSGHLSSPSVEDCPSEQDVRPSEKERGPWRKASSDGLDQRTKLGRCPCGHNTPCRTQGDRGEIHDDAGTCLITLIAAACALVKVKLCENNEIKKYSGMQNVCPHLQLKDAKKINIYIHIHLYF